MMTESVYDMALKYAELGFTVIPVDYLSKKPSVEWKAFQERKPTPEELKAWFENVDAKNIGVVCSDNLVILDFDDAQSYEQFLGPAVSNIQQATPIVKTSRGYHIWFRSKEPMSSFNVPELKLNVLSSGHFVMAPPSIHPSGVQYEFVNEFKQPQEMEHFEQSIRDRCEELGAKPPAEAGWVPVTGKIIVKPWRRLPTETQAYFTPVAEGEREQRAFKIAAMLLNEWKFKDATVQEWLTAWNEENKPPLEPDELQHAIETARKGYIFSKETLQPVKSLKRKLIAADIKDSIFSPTPSEPLEYGSDEELWNEIVQFTKENVELPETVSYHVTTGFMKATWRVEQANNATYLNVLAPQGSGKSRLLEVLNWLCRMSIHSEGATRSAIVRASNGTNATLLLDEADNWLDERDFDNQIMAVLNGGYRRRVFGGGTLLTENTGKNQFEVKAYDSFGFKVIAGRNPLGPTLGSRCIEIRIRKSNRLFPVHIDYDKVWTLRRKLLAYSERHKDEPLECRLVDEKIKDGRVREIFEPIMAAAPNQQIRTMLLDYGVEVCGEKQEEEQTGDDALVAAAIKAVGNGKTAVAISSLVEYLNETIKNPVEHWSNRKVGRISRRIGYNITHGKHGNMIHLDEKVTSYLTERYGLEENDKVNM